MSQPRINNKTEREIKHFNRDARQRAFTSFCNKTVFKTTFVSLYTAEAVHHF